MQPTGKASQRFLQSLASRPSSELIQSFTQAPLFFQRLYTRCTQKTTGSASPSKRTNDTHKAVAGMHTAACDKGGIISALSTASPSSSLATVTTLCRTPTTFTRKRDRVGGSTTNFPHLHFVLSHRRRLQRQATFCMHRRCVGKTTTLTGFSTSASVIWVGVSVIGVGAAGGDCSTDMDDRS